MALTVPRGVAAHCRTSELLFGSQDKARALFRRCWRRSDDTELRGRPRQWQQRNLRLAAVVTVLGLVSANSEVVAEASSPIGQSNTRPTGALSTTAKSSSIFGAPTNYALGGGVVSLAVGSLTGPGGLPDIVTGNSNGTVNVLMNQGGGTFASPETYTVSPQGYAVHVAIGNATGHSFADIIAAVSDPTGVDGIAVLPGNGDGTFASTAIYSSVVIGQYQDTPISIAVGDFNGDGKLDAAIGFYPGGANSAVMRTYFGDGAGHFSYNATYGVDNTYGDVSIIEALHLSSSPLPDLVAVNGDNCGFNAGVTRVFTNDGAGTFSNTGTVFSSQCPNTPAIDDFFGNGLVDLVSRTGCALCDQEPIEMAVSDGDGTFSGEQPLSVGQDSEGSSEIVTNMTAADMNGDGHPDLVFDDTGDNVTSQLGIALGLGSGQFQQATFYTGGYLGLRDGGLLTADLLGNGESDVISASAGGVSVWLNQLTPPPSASQTVLFPLTINARVLTPFHGTLAFFTHAAGGVTAASFKAHINWGDGSTSQGSIKTVNKIVAGFLRTSGVIELKVTGEHTYHTLAATSAVVTVTGPDGLSTDASDKVSVAGLSPTAFFIPDPTKPTNGDIALTSPVPQSPLQEHIATYVWHFLDGSAPVIDNSSTHKQYIKLLKKLNNDPGNIALQLEAVELGIMPGTSSSSVVKQIADVWLTYFPLHIVPHIYPLSGTTVVSLQEVATNGASSTYSTPVPVADHCLVWGGGWIPGLSNLTTCDTINGFDAVFGGPRRRPDFYTYDFSVSGGIGDFGLSVTVTHDDTVFLAAHVGVGVSAGTPNASVSAGFVGPPNGPLPQDSTIDQFVDGLTVAVQAQVGPIGLNLIFNPKFGTGGEEYVVHGGSSASLSAGPGCSILYEAQDSAFSRFAPHNTGPWPTDGGPIPVFPKALQQSLFATAGQLAQQLLSCKSA
jgi:hypothetical protein